MLHTNTIDDVVLALADAPVDARTGNRVLYGVSWLADQDSMIGQVNEDWVRRELDWFHDGSNLLSDMEGPVPKLFQACAGTDGAVNSAYGHILFSRDVDGEWMERSLYWRAVHAFLTEGAGTRHSVAIISDRDIHNIAHKNGRNDFICTNALNFMIDAKGALHITAQMRSMDAVFGYRADYSMWDSLMGLMVADLNAHAEEGVFTALGDLEVKSGTITFQVANLHVYPRHFQLLADTAADTQERLDRRVWQQPSFSERMGLRDQDNAAPPFGRDR